MGNPNLEVTLDFILADDTPLFVDKCVTQTHGGSHLQYFKEATSSPQKLQYLFAQVENRLELWKEMFEREGVNTVGGVFAEVHDESYLLDKLYTEMSDYVNFISDSPVKSNSEIASEENALEEFKQLKNLHTEGLHATKKRFIVYVVNALINYIEISEKMLFVCGRRVICIGRQKKARNQRMLIKSLLVQRCLCLVERKRVHC
jgi:hypothetical protein